MAKIKIQFKEQYNQKFKFKSLGGFMQIRKILHPEQQESCTIVLIPGWCESFAVMRPVAMALFDKGYNIVVLDYQYLDNLEFINNGNFDDLPESIPKNEYAKALALVGFLTDDGYKDISIVAHSEGAIIGTLAAYIQPDMFKDLILVNPAGFIEEKTFTGLFTRLVYSMYKQDVRNFGRHLWLQLRYFKEVLVIMVKNPIQALKDGLSMANYNIVKQVSSVCTSGVQVNLIFNKVDVLFPLRELLIVSEGLCTNDPYIMDGGHNEMYIKTKEFVNLVSKIIK